ncbi:Hydroxypyruvate reductase [Dehalogenimonas lykanthroporepellens BL-DC-9]|jgi:glycerate-2-kinase|nr:Hydroxypyruvate reductase [Dehalogenimonas lykanthroporepellens BL-DC-9]
MRVRNREELAQSPAAEAALDIVEAGITAVLPEVLLRRALAYRPDDDVLAVGEAEYALNGGRLFVIGGGKAAGGMALALERLIGAGRITAGMVVTRRPGDGPSVIEILPGGHPLPDGRGVAATGRMLAMKEAYGIGAGDTVVCLISGGASALMAYPVPGILLEDKRRLTELLMGSGADITEMNTIRKHISAVKGGRLGRHFAPARVISLVISDVVTDDLSVIASGPTTPDPATFSHAVAVIDRYRLAGRVPLAILRYLSDGVAGGRPETPKSLDNCHNYVIGNVKTALKAMTEAACRAGYRAVIIDDGLNGDTEGKAVEIAAAIRSGRYAGYDALVAGGETTIELTESHGRGGRNQHFAAVTLREMAEFNEPWLAITVGSDGADYLDGVAGAMVSRGTAERVAKKGVPVADYIKNCDTWSLFRETGGTLVVTGDTGTNVGDLALYLLK